MGATYINGKFINQPKTGVQRYAYDVSQTLDYTLQYPEKSSTSSFALARWEQLTLPHKISKHDLLINLCNTAPICHHHQIVTIHDMAVFHNHNWFTRAFRTYYKWLLPYLIRHSQCIVTVSEFSKSEILKYTRVAPNKIIVNAPCVSEELLKVNAVKPTGLNNDRFILLVGTNNPRKNFDFVIKHLKEFLEYAHLKLAIVGSESANFNSININPNSNLLRFNSASDAELKWLYQNAELLIQPSFYEGYSLVPLEALAFGARVLASDIDVHHEVLGTHASYFKLNNPHDLKTQVTKALTKPKPSGRVLRNLNSLKREWELLISKFS